jgi:hypothetical protein
VGHPATEPSRGPHGVSAVAHTHRELEAALECLREIALGYPVKHGMTNESYAAECLKLFRVSPDVVIHPLENGWAEVTGPFEGVTIDAVWVYRDKGGFPDG